MATRKTIALGTSAAALALAAGLGLAGAASAAQLPASTSDTMSSTAAEDSNSAPGRGGHHGNRGQVADLAAKLGVEEGKVTAALEEIRAARQSERAAELKSRLDTAVGDGTLTQEEADAVTKAVEKGVIGGH